MKKSRAKTQVRGWSGAQVTGQPGQVIETKVRIAGSKRKVRTQKRIDGRWRTVKTFRETRSGVARVKMTIGTAPVSWRLVVPAKGRYKRIVTSDKVLAPVQATSVGGGGGGLHPHTSDGDGDGDSGVVPATGLHGPCGCAVAGVVCVVVVVGGGVVRGAGWVGFGVGFGVGSVGVVGRCGGEGGVGSVGHGGGAWGDVPAGQCVDPVGSQGAGCCLPG